MSATNSLLACLVRTIHSIVFRLSNKVKSVLSEVAGVVVLSSPLPCDRTKQSQLLCNKRPTPKTKKKKTIVSALIF